MRRMVLAAAALALPLTACSDFPFKPDDGEAYSGNGVIEWRVTIGPDRNILFAQDENIDIPAELTKAWEEQQNLIRINEANQLAERVVTHEPDYIKLVVSIVTVPGYAPGRPEVCTDGMGGVVSTLLDALLRMGTEYRVSGMTPPSLDYEFDLVMEDGSEHSALWVTKGFRLKRCVPEF